MADRDNASNRVDPKTIGSDQFAPFTFATQPSALATLLPFLVIFNGDAVAHTFTFTLRGNGGAAAITFTTVIEAGKLGAFPTLVLAAVSIDSVTSSVVGVYTDVAPSGPSVAAGSGPAPSVTHNFAETITPTADSTAQMGGLGSILAMTPKKSGNVRITATIGFVANTVSNEMYVKGAYGTGGAPAKNAASTGTLSTQIGTVQTPTATEGVQFSVSTLFTGLTLGTAYWFDLVAFVQNTSDSIQVLDASIEELPA